jgi:hypothetical protein
MRKKRFAFISRHVPTEDQIQLADQLRIELVHVGDEDAFSETAAGDKDEEYEGVVVVNPAAALNYILKVPVGVFENAARPGVDGKPSFKAVSFRVWNLQQGDDCYWHCDKTIKEK